MYPVPLPRTHAIMAMMPISVVVTWIETYHTTVLALSHNVLKILFNSACFHARKVMLLVVNFIGLFYSKRSISVAVSWVWRYFDYIFVRFNLSIPILSMHMPHSHIERLSQKIKEGIFRSWFVNRNDTSSLKTFACVLESSEEFWVW